MRNQNSGWPGVGCEVNGLERYMKELSGVIEMFYIFTGVVVKQVYTVFKINQIIHFKMSAFYVNCTSIFKKDRIVGRKNNTIYN